MQEKVQAFLDKCELTKQKQEDYYYYYVMSYANLFADERGFVEVSKNEYNNYSGLESGTKKIEDGHYYVVKRFPLQVSDEEFTAIENAIPKDKLAEFRLQASGINIEKERESSSKAAIFFTVLAWVLWIGGLFISIKSGVVTSEISSYFSYTSSSSQFVFSVFMSSFITYLIGGCICLCAAELFKKLQTIVNLLRRKQ